MKLKWDQTGEHYYETGVKKGVLYPIQANNEYSLGVAWNGLTAVTESPSGAEETKLFADDIKYLSLRSAEEFGGTIEAYTYPDEWMLCDGSASLSPLVPGVVIGQQNRNTFGLCYRTSVGNDTDGNDKGYKLHLVYGCTASPSERAYATINDSPEAITFSWEFSSTPVEVPSILGDFKPTSLLTIDTTKQGITEANLRKLEDVLYGTDSPSYEEETGLTESMFNLNKTKYYTRTGSIGSYEYVRCEEDDTYSSTETYYVQLTGTPRLPLPEEVIEILTAA